MILNICRVKQKLRNIHCKSMKSTQTINITQAQSLHADQMAIMVGEKVVATDDKP